MWIISFKRYFGKEFVIYFFFIFIEERNSNSKNFKYINHSTQSQFIGGSIVGIFAFSRLSFWKSVMSINHVKHDAEKMESNNHVKKDTRQR